MRMRCAARWVAAHHSTAQRSMAAANPRQVPCWARQCVPRIGLLPYQPCVLCCYSQPTDLLPLPLYYHLCRSTC